MMAADQQPNTSTHSHLPRGQAHDPFHPLSDITTGHSDSSDLYTLTTQTAAPHTHNSNSEGEVVEVDVAEEEDAHHIWLPQRLQQIIWRTFCTTPCEMRVHP